MALIPSKTNWQDLDAPIASDFNRIEGNISQLSVDINAEASSRAAGDTALDNAKLNKNSNGPKTVTDISLSGSQTYVIPAGTYYIYIFPGSSNNVGNLNVSGQSIGQYRGNADSTLNRDITTMIMSDGTDASILNGSGTASVRLIRIA